MHLFNSTVCTHYEKSKFVYSTIFHSHVVNVDCMLEREYLGKSGSSD